MKRTKKARVFFGIVLLILFFFVLSSSIKNYDLDSLLAKVSPDVVYVTVEVTVTPELPEEEIIETPEPTPTIDPNSPEGRAAAMGLPKPPDIDINSWEFLLANGDNSIDEYEPPELVKIAGETDEQYDTRIVEALKAFAQDARDQNLPVYLSSGYRSYSTQAANFVRICQNNGVADGKNANGFYITMPAGCSEHQTGLACDITDIYRNPKRSEEIEPTATFQYMKDRCQEFGFILRFPKDKESVTGVMFEPYHYRYVGVEAAKYIMENGLCLEEFISLYRDIN